MQEVEYAIKARWRAELWRSSEVPTGVQINFDWPASSNRIS